MVFTKQILYFSRHHNRDRRIGIDSAYRRCETGKALDEGSEHLAGPEEL